LVGFLEQFDQVSTDAAVTSVVESGRDTSVTGSTSSTDSMGVFGNVGRQVVQDDVLDVGNVQTSGGDGSSDQDGCSTGLELLQSPFSFSLGSVTVNGGSVQASVTQKVTKGVGHSLGFHKDQGQSIGLGADDIQQEGSLVIVFDKLDSLGNVLGGRTDSTDGQEDIVLQEVSRQHLNFSGESGGEHECLTVLNTGHVLTFDNLSDLRFEAHVQHSISFIEDQVLDVGQRDLATVDQIDQSTGSGGQKVATSFDRSDLSTNVGTTVSDGGPDPRSVSKLSSFLVDLRHQFSGRSQDQGGRVDLSRSRVRVGSVGVDRRFRRSLGEQVGQDGEQETTSLS
jgi:hypothetical protein